MQGFFAPQHSGRVAKFRKVPETILVQTAAMRRTVPLLAALLLAVAVAQAGARSMPPASVPAPSALCRTAILQAERAGGVPDRLLDAIATVESGRRDPVSGLVYPWPWTINVEGTGHVYETKEAAIAAVQAFQAGGARSIDVGCLQVNLMYHPGAFASLEQAFDPVANASYGAHFLLQLFNQTNAWPRAVAAYHSATPDIGAEYARKVIAAWGVPQPPVAGQLVAAAMPQPAAAPASPPFGSQPGRVAVLLPSGTEPIRVLPLPTAPGAAAGGNAGQAGAPLGAGRSLDSYRAAPVSMALRVPRAS